MKILSIDPGYDKVGYAVFVSEKGMSPKLETSGLIKTQKSSSLQERIHFICKELVKIAKDNKVEVGVIEQLFFFKNAKTVIAVAQAQGAIIQTLSSIGVAISFLTPLEIKQAVTGDGRADKAGVWKMLKLQLGNELRVGDDDESDAIACGLAYCHIQKFS